MKIQTSHTAEAAKAITDEITNHMDTTTKLRQVIEKLWISFRKKRRRRPSKDLPAYFPGLRIDVNREFEVLYEFMEKLPGALKPGGRQQSLRSIQERISW